jgi:hypothetical protein
MLDFFGINLQYGLFFTRKKLVLSLYCKTSLIPMKKLTFVEQSS